MIPKDFINTLLARVDIVDVIDKRVPLKKRGASYAACCPFHQEKSASFSVSPAKQIFRCFSCGAHGNAIDFLKQHGGMTFPEAVESLAVEVGLTVPEVEHPFKSKTSSHEDTGATDDLYERMRAAAAFYAESLKTAEPAIDYLKRRGLTGDIARRFCIGYAPDDWQPLKAVFSDYATAPLDTVGLVVQKDKGKRFDFFKGRVMFPIKNTRGKVIGFGGRVLDNSEPKYLNSPETPLFSKGRELYGLYEARDAIRKNGAAIVVEGYMDVIALAQHGIDYCVATLGTSTSGVQAQKLFRQTNHIIFCFDGDNAGKNAAWNALLNTLPVLKDDKRASFLFLPEGLDPDEFIRERGKDAFDEIIKNAMPLSDFLLTRQSEQFMPEKSAENSAAFVGGVLPLIAKMTDAPTLAALIRKRVASITGLEDRDLLAALPKQKATRRPARLNGARI